MSASASHLNFHRCGENGFNQRFGALLIGTDLENIDGLTVDHVNIDSPTFKGIDIRSIPAPPSHAVVATLGALTLKNIELLAAPACAAVNAYTGGSAQFNNVCVCSSTAATPSACAVSGVPRIQWTAFLRDATVASNSSGLTPPRCVCRRVRL